MPSLLLTKNENVSNCYELQNNFILNHLYWTKGVVKNRMSNEFEFTATLCNFGDHYTEHPIVVDVKSGNSGNDYDGGIVNFTRNFVEKYSDRFTTKDDKDHADDDDDDDEGLRVRLRWDAMESQNNHERLLENIENADEFMFKIQFIRENYRLIGFNQLFPVTVKEEQMIKIKYTECGELYYPDSIRQSFNDKTKLYLRNNTSLIISRNIYEWWLSFRVCSPYNNPVTTYVCVRYIEPRKILKIECENQKICLKHFAMLTLSLRMYYWFMVKTMDGKLSKKMNTDCEAKFRASSEYKATVETCSEIKHILDSIAENETTPDEIEAFHAISKCLYDCCENLFDGIPETLFKETFDVNDQQKDR